MQIPPMPEARIGKFFIASAFLLTLVIVLAIPFFALRELIFSAQSTSVGSQFVSGDTTIEPIMNATPASPPGPLGKLILPPTGKIMTGLSISNDLNAINNFEKNSGKKVSVLLFYQAWRAADGEQKFPVGWMNFVRNQGSIPQITWEPWIGKAYPLANNEPEFALKNIIAGNFDGYIKQWAQAARAWRNPFFLRFAPEMNGAWTPWSEGVNGNKAGEFVQAWRHVYTIFKAVGATNVTWMWCPNINYPGSTNISELYPGDAYVDWTGMDGFNWGTTTQHSKWLTFSQVFSSTYNNILTITNKPIMIAETGCVEKGGDKAAWITNAYSIELPERFPLVKAVVWFDQFTQQDWRIESSPTAQQAFAQAMQSPFYISNIYGGNYIG